MSMNNFIIPLLSKYNKYLNLALNHQIDNPLSTRFINNFETRSYTHMHCYNIFRIFFFL